MSADVSSRAPVFTKNPIAAVAASLECSAAIRIPFERVVSENWYVNCVSFCLRCQGLPRESLLPWLDERAWLK